MHAPTRQDEPAATAPTTARADRPGHPVPARVPDDTADHAGRPASLLV